jgi:hypothetical protein
MDGSRVDGSARLRVNGSAALDESETARVGIPGAKRIIRMTAEHIFTNCPRYIPTMAAGEESIYTPRDGYTPPDPAWKSRDFMKDIFDAERDEN